MTLLDIMNISIDDILIINDEEFVVTDKRKETLFSIATSATKILVTFALHSTVTNYCIHLTPDELLAIDNLSVKGKGCINLPHIESNLDRV